MSAFPFLMLASSILPFHHDGQVALSRYEIPAWRISVARDRFTGARHCELYQGSRRRPSVRYFHNTLAFQFPRRLDTVGASFKLDDGVASDWTVIYPQLVQSGVNLEGRSLDNPTEGRVLLPMNALGRSNTITIRPTPSSRPRRFTVAGLGDALASARGLACDPETSFDR